MTSIGVIGAGVMGTGVAQCFAQHDFNVVLVDISDEALEKAKADIYKNLRFHALFDKSNAAQDHESIIGRISFTKEYERLREVEFLIENVTEKIDIKKAVYKEIDKICREDCIFAVNTSCISITQIASFTGRPSRVIGTHFMNPVPMKRAIEIVKGYHTSDETIACTKQLLGAIGKECIVVNDYPGFVSNRLSHLLMNEAAFVVQDQVAAPEDVDYIFKKCYEHKMGPLETADLIGLDTVVNSLDILYESFQDPKFRCCPLLRRMVNAGLLGKKSGEGFYKYY